MIPDRETTPWAWVNVLKRRITDYDVRSAGSIIWYRPEGAETYRPLVSLDYLDQPETLGEMSLAGAAMSAGLDTLRRLVDAPSESGRFVIAWPGNPYRAFGGRIGPAEQIEVKGREADAIFALRITIETDMEKYDSMPTR